MPRDGVQQCALLRLSHCGKLVAISRQHPYFHHRVRSAWSWTTGRGGCNKGRLPVRSGSRGGGGGNVAASIAMSARARELQVELVGCNSSVAILDEKNNHK
jgi:hypothetical protein